MIRQGKGGRDRVIPIGDRAVYWVRRYLDESRPKLVVEPDQGTLFLTDPGDSFTPGRLTKLVADQVEASGISKRGSCHLFRHTMATLMLEGSAEAAREDGQFEVADCDLKPEPPKLLVDDQGDE